MAVEVVASFKSLCVCPSLCAFVSNWLEDLWRSQIQRMGMCRAGDILNALLDVGDSSNDNGLTGITCGPGLSPVGFSASSMCLAITTFQACPGFQEYSS